jgi:hypothetical protein
LYWTFEIPEVLSHTDEKAEQSLTDNKFSCDTWN